MFWYRTSKLDTLVDKIFDKELESNYMQWTWPSHIPENPNNRYEKLPIISINGTCVEIKITLPGYEKDDLNLQIEKGTLIVYTVESSDNPVVHNEYSLSAISDKIDVDSAKATMKAGILTIIFDYYKKPKECKSIKIE